MPGHPICKGGIRSRYVRFYGRVAEDGHFIIGIIITAAVITLPSLNEGFGWLQSLVPLPVFYYLRLEGEKRGNFLISLAVVLSALIGAFTGRLQIILYSYMLLPLGFLFAHASRRNESVTSTAIKGVILFIVLWLIYGLYYSAVNHSNPYGDALAEFDKSISDAYATFDKQYGATSVEMSKELHTAYKQLRLFIPRIFPALLGMTILSTVWLNIFLGHVLLKKKGEGLSPWKDLSGWRLPEWLIWGAILAGFCMLLPWQPVKTLCLNILLTYGLLYFIQGLTVFAGMLSKWKVPRLVRLIMYIFLALFQVYSILFLIVLGVSDIWTSARFLEKKEDLH